MGRYTKITSDYIKSKRHQTLSDGSTIFERDWVTVGNDQVQQLDPGKKVYYSDSNFIFTINATKDYKKKHSTGKWVGSFYLDDVLGSSDEVNTVKVNFKSNDLRNYAYYGSAVELVKTSIENIIMDFPGRLKVTSDIYNKQGVNNTWIQLGYILDNQFGIDMHTDKVDLDVYTNEMRYLSYSWANYKFIDFENNVRDITSYTITSFINKVPTPDMYHNAGYDIVYYNGKLYKWSDDEHDYVLADYSGNCQNYFVRCNEYIKYLDAYYEWSDEDSCYNPIFVYEICDENDQVLYQIDMTLEGVGYTVTVFAVKNGDGFTYVTNSTPFIIEPKQEYIERYFNNLSGFEAKLLERGSSPLYTSKFLVPYQLSNGNYTYIERKFTWPSNDYCLDIECPSYFEYVSKLYDLAEQYDNMWSDNIWRRMTHEAIQNFDWAYRREYDEEDTQANIAGGTRMQDVLRLYGRLYDDLKREIEGIKFTNNVSYDGNNNITNAELSDRTELHGWDNVSTMWEPYYYVQIDSVPSGVTPVIVPVVPTKVTDVSPDYISVGCEGNAVFYHKLQNDPSAEHLTEEFVDGESQPGSHWIEKANPWITSNIMGFHYSSIGYTSPNVADDYWNNENTYYNNEIPFVINANSPVYIRVINNNGIVEYFEKFTNYPIGYLHSKWYGAVNIESSTPASVDLDYQRRLMLSTTRMFKSKGTLESVEMALGMFGLENGPNGDYTLTERHWGFSPYKYDQIFPFYELLYDEPEGVTWDSSNTFEEMPVAGIGSPSPIRVGDSTGYMYYSMNTSYKLNELINELWQHKTSDNLYDDAYSGVPINDVTYRSGHYIIPFYDKSRRYEGDIYFQMKGGWGKKDQDISTNNNYEETISYLHMVPMVSSLLEIMPSKLNEDDIYYVNDISDYVDFDEDVPFDLSHFFKITNIYTPFQFASWKNIPMEGEIVYNTNYSNANGITHQDYLHAKYLADIIPSFMYNNPHVGYGNYDNGEEFRKFMRRPYTYLVENFSYDDTYYVDLAKQIEYFLDQIDTTNLEGKIENLSDIKRNQDHYEYVAIQDIPDSYQDVSVFPEQPAENDSEYIRYDGQFYKLTLKHTTIIPNDGEEQYINDKVLIIHNIHNNNYHRQFLMDVVMKYVFQMIPSTTILILDNFELENSHSLIYYDIVAESNNPTWGTANGTGSYLQGTYAVIKAVPADGYRFVKWEKSVYSYEKCDPVPDPIEMDEVPTTHIDGSFPQYIYVDGRYYELHREATELTTDATTKVLVCDFAVYTAEFDMECAFKAECMTVCGFNVNCELDDNGGGDEPTPPEPPTPTEPATVDYCLGAYDAETVSEVEHILGDYAYVFDDTCAGYYEVLASPVSGMEGQYNVTSHSDDSCRVTARNIRENPVSPETLETYPLTKTYDADTEVSLLAATGSVATFFKEWHITEPGGEMYMTTDNPVSLTVKPGNTKVSAIYEYIAPEPTRKVEYSVTTSNAEGPEMVAELNDSVALLDSTCTSFYYTIDSPVPDEPNQYYLHDYDPGLDCAVSPYPITVEDVNPDTLETNYIGKAYTNESIGVVAAINDDRFRFKVFRVINPDESETIVEDNPMYLHLEEGTTKVTAIYSNNDNTNEAR